MAGGSLEKKQRIWISRFLLLGLALFLCFSWIEISNQRNVLNLIPSRLANYIGPSETSVVEKGIAGPLRPKLAICLVGGARKFELTGPSLLKHVLNKYPNSDVFLHAPLDKDSHKFSILKAVNNLAMVRIFVPQWLNDTLEQLEVLTASNSPNGIQGLLQYFNLVEGCLTMIKSYQDKYKIKYDWIIRTRVDGYWTGPLPPPKRFSRKQYIVPPGSQFGGLNDRLGIGNMETSEVALARLSLIPLLHNSSYRNLNSETAFKHQLDVKGVPFKFHVFPFCILSERQYSWPPSHFGVPVASISTKGPLNGAKCRPCEPVSKGKDAAEIIGSLARNWSWTLSPQDLKLCDAHQPWQENWESIFDKVAGSKFADTRKAIKSRSLDQCIRDVELLKLKTVVWDAPEPRTICRRAFSELQ